MTKIKHNNIKSSYLYDLLQHTHGTLIWGWQMIMGASLVNAVTQSYPLFISLILHLDNYIPFNGELKRQINSQIYQDPSLEIAQKISDTNAILGLLIFFLGFIPTFIRFYYGISRHIYLSYFEITKMPKYSLDNDYIEKLEKLSEFKQFFDTIMLTFSSATFVFLANTIRLPLIFIVFYAFIMLVNVIWLICRDIILTKQSFSASYMLKLLFYRRSILGKNLTKKYAYLNAKPQIWIINNLIFLALFIINCTLYKLHIWHSPNGFIISNIVLIFINSFYDLSKAWHFYFPNFAEVYRKETVD
jgi:hypothetical protein